MPYEIKKVSSGYKVCKKKKKKCFSKKALEYDNALAQMRAIIISENKRKTGSKNKRKTGSKNKRKTGSKSKSKSLKKKKTRSKSKSTHKKVY